MKGSSGVRNCLSSAQHTLALRERGREGEEREMERERGSSRSQQITAFETVESCSTEVKANFITP
jgi:hypothetical protein